MPFDPSQLPDIKGDYETPEEKLKRQLNELAGLLGDNFSWNNGLRYQGNRLAATLNNKGLSFTSPLYGGNLRGSVSLPIEGDSRGSLRYDLPFLGGDLSGSVTDIGSGDPRYSLKFKKSFK